MVFYLVEKIHQSLYRKSFYLTKKKHTGEINELISKKNGSQIASKETDENQLLNISKRQLTQIKIDLLAKGLNFSITSEAI